MKSSHSVLTLGGALWLGTVAGLHAQIYSFCTIAGNPSIVDQKGDPIGAYADGTNRQARFNFPLSVAVSSAGTVFVADTLNNAIRTVTRAEGGWVVRTIAGAGPTAAGSADGTNTQAQFNIPQGIAVDPAGKVYVADTLNNVIRQITPQGGDWVVTTIAGLAGVSGPDDGTGAEARFNLPVSVAVDSATNVYVADYGANTIRKMTPSGGGWAVTTIAGAYLQTGSEDGTNSQARFRGPGSIAADAAGRVYVSDWENSTIRKISPAGAYYAVTTIAGEAGQAGWVDGTNSNARFSNPLGGIGADSEGNLYVTDAGMIRKVAPVGTNWVVTTIAGAYGQVGASNGIGSSVRFYYPQAVAADSAGNLYVADSNNHTIRLGVPSSATPVALHRVQQNNRLILSWPLSASQFVLETASTPSPGAVWTALSNGVVISGENFVRTNTSGPTQAFYRLRLSN